MSEEKKNQPPSDLPKAKLKKQKTHFSIVWVVPIVAAIVAGYLVYQRVREFGPKIKIAFTDAEGIRAGETVVTYRGVNVGEVKAVKLSKDLKTAVVTVRLRSEAKNVAHEKSQFWVVRPTFQGANITGLGTLVSGPHIEVLPGDGSQKLEFVGLNAAPVLTEHGGLKIILISAHMAAVSVGSPIYYRGVEVGSVAETRLSTNASTAEIHVLIQKRFAPLIRSGTKFWKASGIDVKLGLFKGAEINVESLRSLWAGGIAFATPSDLGTPVEDGMVYALNEEVKKDWLEWSPEIEIQSDDAPLPQGVQQKEAARMPPLE